MENTIIPKQVVITGGSRGIGFGLAENFLKRGCSVTISGRNQDDLEKAAHKLSGLFGRNMVLAIVCDVTQHSQVEELWKSAVLKFGKVDIWINNAGVCPPYKKTAQLTQEEIESVANTNLTSVMTTCRFVFNEMASQGTGIIANSEGFGSNGMKREGLTVYGTTKNAIRYFTRSMAKEVEGTGVFLGTISPGMVLTDLLMGSLDKLSDSYQSTRKVFNLMAEKVETVTPWLVEKILQVEKNDFHINYSPTWKLGLRALRNFVTKREIIK